MCAFVRLCVRWCAVSGAGWAQRLSSRGCGGGEGLAAEGARVPESLRPAEAVREYVQEDLPHGARRVDVVGKERYPERPFIISETGAGATLGVALAVTLVV